jgi:hypothetical protein
LVAVLVLCALALRPVAPVERAAGWLFAPARWLAELARPLTWLEVRSVRAALADAEAAEAAERESARALLLSEQESALPRDPALRAGRGFLVAEVLERPKDHDLVRVRFPRGAGVQPEMPVTCGDVYLGRVLRLDPKRPGEGIVQLVTDEGLRVGAQAGGPDGPRLVVGGLVNLRRRDAGVLHLGAQHESREALTGEVRVLEAGGGPLAALRARADGFRLGRLVPISDRGRRLITVETGFDYAYGISQVAIVGGSELSTAGPLLAEDPFDESAWTPARVTIAGDATPGRRTRRLAFAAGAPVQAGAAVALGARFVGRVESAASGSAVASLLGDPGLEVPAVALVAGAAAPVPLGRLVVVGSTSDGRVRLRWDAREVAPGAAPRPSGRARIATSAGERGVPSGLWVGACDLPAAQRTQELLLEPAQAPEGLLRVLVRVAPLPEEDAP